MDTANQCLNQTKPANSNKTAKSQDDAHFIVLLLCFIVNVFDCKFLKWISFVEECLKI